MESNATPLFSVIVPAYNLEKLLPRCLDSLLAQTFAGWECVAVDDGSADGTGTVCDEYAAKDPRFTALHQENGGVSSARNTGIKAARAEHLLFLDGDDTLAPGTLEWLAARLEEHPDDLIGYRLRGEEEPEPDPAGFSECRLFTAAQCPAYMATGAAGNVTTKVFSARVIREKDVWFDPALPRGEDQDFCFRYTAAFFEQRPQAMVRQFSAKLYVVHKDNIGHRASGQNLPTHSIDWDPEASRGYAARLMKEYGALVSSMGGWEGFTPEEQLYMAHQYARRFAFAVWAARQLGEELPEGFWGSGGVGGLTEAMTRYRLYCAYYWPLRLRWKRLIAAVYHSDESESMRLYWKVFLVGDILLGRRWNRL